MLSETVIRLRSNISHCLEQGRPLLPVVVRKPRILGHWLISARHAQLFLLAALILLPTLVPFIVDPILDFIFPAETRQRLFGILSTSEANPLRNGAGYVTYTLLIVSALAVFAYLLLRYLPPAVHYAGQYSQGREQEADRLLDQQPDESIRLYDEAAHWTPDPARETSVRGKIDEVCRRTGLSLEAVLAPESAPDPAPTPSAPPVTADGTAIVDRGALNPVPGLIGQRYEIGEQLGQGAMGIVYRARDTKLDRQVALKQLAPALMQDESLLARFRQEARALARLSHGNIVQVYDFLESDGQCWIIMELVEGRGLDEMLSSGAMKMTDIRNLGRQMALGLAYAHDKGVIHRDFKPANVLITPDMQVKITDFGIARIANASVKTQLNAVLGSPAYMSPEQANGDSVDHRADIYALGITLYWMATGRLPFQGDASAVLAQHLTRQPEPLGNIRPGIAKAFEKLVLRMLAKKPEQRPKDMREVAGLL